MRLLATALLVAAAGVAVPALAQARPPGPGMGGPVGMTLTGDPAQLTRMADRMLDGLGASEAQRAQIRQIAQAAATDLKAQHDANRALRDKGLQLLAEPTLDPAAAEALRQQMQAQRDQASKRMLQAMLDVGKVLTPEQRAKLAERMTQRAEAMHDRVQRRPASPVPPPPEQKG